MKNKADAETFYKKKLEMDEVYMSGSGLSKKNNLLHATYSDGFKSLPQNLNNSVDKVLTKRGNE